MKSKGSAIIYVVILLIPVTLLAFALSELALTDSKTSSNISNSQQAIYNCDTGIRYGLKKLQKNFFDKGYTGYNTNKNIEIDGDRSSCSALINCIGDKFTIKSTGNYKGFTRTKTIELQSNSILNLGRKISCGGINTNGGRVNFKNSKTITGGYIKLSEYDQIMLLKEAALDKATGIYSYFADQNPEDAQRYTGEYLFQRDNTGIFYTPTITSNTFVRRKWIPQGENIRYYISDKGENLNLNIENLNREETEFLKEFKNLGGIIKEDGSFEGRYVKVILADGNINIENIKGDNSQKYFDNLVIYCTGRVSINNCEFMKPGEKSDINISIIANEVEFISPPGETGNIVSYLGGNEGLIKAHEKLIVEIIQANTAGEFMCAAGY